MLYLSICSGIEAASVAWRPMGWQCAGFAEIDDFPSAVLARRYPEVHNYGDFTKLTRADFSKQHIDVLIGGTPCQSYSVAGQREGAADHRGDLAFEYVRLANRVRPTWLVFENVPGLITFTDGRSRSAESVCGLWRVLAPSGTAPERYYSSPRKCRGILRRAAKRGKKLPPALELALRATAALTSRE